MSYEPGRKLDGLISAYVFGAEPEWFKGIPAYSTDIAAAWLVIEKVKHLHGACGIVVTPTTTRANFGVSADAYVEAPTAAQAICLAALKAVQA